MSENTRTFSQIQEKIKQGKAVVLTADEICNRVRSGEIVRFEDVDVVTTATRAIMSGTYAVLSFPVAEPDSFIRASHVWMNGVPAHVGPCPNERIGIVDIIVNGTAYSKSNPNYGGGHLFKDLAEGKAVVVKVETFEGRFFETRTTIKQIPHARLFATRHAFKNYLAFVNPKNEPTSSIFHASQFKGNLSEATFCGCGELNPIKNDPKLETIGIGTRILINGAEGFVAGTGTRSSPEKPNLSGFADMKSMVSEYMGGFITSAGPEIINTWAVPVPVLNQNLLDSIIKLDSELKLDIVDVNGRVKLCETTYADVWEGSDTTVTYNPDRCIKCCVCEVERTCPTGAVKCSGLTIAVHDAKLCFNCGLCVSICDGRSFSANLGTLHYNDGKTEKDIPVVVRQSDRVRALKAAEELKQKILSGDFKITEPVERIFP
ncbi:MAG: methanogenesis marker 16 metalloprotein [Methanosarcinaceae archaeon]|nr:methanogenesis marker 16 metalloprotein [Methanosarcinaceae archaeon]